MQRGTHNLAAVFCYGLRGRSIIGSRKLANVATALVEPDFGPSASIRLRDYQEQCIHAVLTELGKGEKRLGISLATGSGKTVINPGTDGIMILHTNTKNKVIFTQLIDRIKPLTQEATQTLILVHRRELVEQASRHCRDAYPFKSIEIEMGSAHASGTADITIASVRSIVSGNRIQKFEPEKFKLVLVDEAHHIVAAGYMEVLHYFGLTQPKPGHISQNINETRSLLAASADRKVPALVGVSATFSRFDGLRLSDAIDRIVYHRDYIDMIGEKWLSAVKFTTVKSKVDISKVKTANSGEFQLGALSRAVNTQETNELTVRAWMTKAADRISTLVFCVDLQHVSDLAAMFQRYGYQAQFVTGDTPNQIRSQKLDAFKRRECPVLLNCGVFTEGTDIPNIDCVLLARPTKSRNLLVQMIGRGMRLHPGKKDCHIIDMVASLEAGVVTTPTLFGLDPATLVEDFTVENMRAKQERQDLESKGGEHKVMPVGVPHQLVTFTDYASVYDLVNDTSFDRHIRGLSELAWVMVRPNRYVLSNLTGDYITIEVFDPGLCYIVRFMKKLSQASPLGKTGKSKSPYMHGRQIAKAGQLVDAVHAADTFAMEKFSRQFVHRGQRWRRNPATEGQLNFLNKLRAKGDCLTKDMVTKGKAIDMISKVKFGAKGWLTDIEAARKRVDRVEEKQRRIKQLRKREEVKVGRVSSNPNEVV